MKIIVIDPSSKISNTRVKDSLSKCGCQVNFRNTKHQQPKFDWKSGFYCSHHTDLLLETAPQEWATLELTDLPSGYIVDIQRLLESCVQERHDDVDIVSESVLDDQDDEANCISEDDQDIEAKEHALMEIDEAAVHGWLSQVGTG